MVIVGDGDVIEGGFDVVAKLGVLLHCPAREDRGPLIQTTTHDSAVNERVFHPALTANETTTLKAKTKNP